MYRFALVVAACGLSLAQAQDLPEGKGKDLLQRLCTDCHGLDVIVSQKATKEGWGSIVDAMVSRGAGGTKEELAAVVDYLSKNFPQDPAKVQAKALRPARR